ncbi:MAG: trypsin-like peptidase domain-containing protein [Saprospiraceae bacterium]|nr:trypsin-like peptidase domain-containing protein [Saprospiraceae bacterium]
MSKIFFKLSLLIILMEITFFNSYCQVGLPSYLSKSVRIIRVDKGGGTGFYYVKDSTTYLVTAAHVLFTIEGGVVTDKLRSPSIELISYDTELSIDNQFKLRVQLDNNLIILKDPKKDVCVIPIAREKEKFSDGNRSLVAFQYAKVLTGLKNIHAFDAKSSMDLDKIFPGDDIILVGYPTTLDYSTYHAPLSNSLGAKVYEFQFPLVQSGIVAGISKTLGNIIISGSVFGGNSGGAVLLKREYTRLVGYNLEFGYNFDLIGIVSEFIPAADTALVDGKKGGARSNSGYSVIIPIQFADDLILKKK